MTANQVDQKIVATLVPDYNRLVFLPKYFGSYFISGEKLVFNWMSRMNTEYRGGYWNFFELSNGGFYMALKKQDERKIIMSTGHVMREVSSDAAGIVVTLFTMNYIINTEYGNVNCSPEQEASIECLYEHFYQLRDYAIEHPESAAIFALID